MTTLITPPQQDSKQFVDMPLKNDPEVVLAEFEKLEDKTDKPTLMDFVSKHFAEVGSRSIQDPSRGWYPWAINKNMSVGNQHSDPIFDFTGKLLIAF